MQTVRGAWVLSNHRSKSYCCRLTGNTVGMSQEAGKRAIFSTLLTRVALPAPVVMMPSLIMSAIKRSNFWAANPRVRVPLEVGS